MENIRDKVQITVANVDEKMGHGYVWKILGTMLAMGIGAVILVKLVLANIINALNPELNTIIYFIIAIIIMLLYNKLFYFKAIDKLFLLSDRKCSISIIPLPIVADLKLADVYLDMHQEVPDRVPYYKATVLAIMSILFTLLVTVSLVDEYITTNFIYSTDRIALEHTLMLITYSLLIIYRMHVLNTLSDAIVDLTPLYRSKLKKVIFILSVVGWILMGLVTPVLFLVAKISLVHPMINVLSLIVPMLVLSPLIVTENTKLVQNLLLQKMEEEE